MKSMLLAAVALAGLMDEATDGTTGSSGGAATEQSKAPDAPGAASAGDSAAGSDQAGSASTEQTAPDVADTSGDTAGQPAGAHLDQAAKGEEPAATEPVAVEETGDEYADACKAGSPKVALVGKYGDKVPVQLTSRAHLERLQTEHPGSVEVQS